MPTLVALSKGERYVPTPEQLAAQKARREAQAAAKAGKQTEVIANTVRKIPWKAHINRNQAINAGLSLGVATGGSVLVHRRRQAVAKRDKTNTAIGAASGAAAVDAAYVVGGQAAKARIKVLRNRQGMTPAQEDIWAKHKQAAGLKPGEAPRGSTPAKIKHKIFAHYPKELPGWKAQRVLGWKNHNGVYGAALAGGAAAGGLIAGRGKREVAKGGLGFALAGGATGSAGLLAAARDKSKHRDQQAREAVAATAGGWAAQGAYQGAGYAAKHRAQAKHGYGSSAKAGKPYFLTNPNGEKIFRTKNQTNNRLKAAEKEIGARRGTADFDRRYPKTLPEWKTHRVLGWTHRGKTGTALGGVVTALGTYGAAEAASRKKHPWQHEKATVGKREYGYMDRKRSWPRTAELGVGLGVASWGASRLHVGPAVSRGVRIAERNGFGPQARGAVVHGRSLRDATRRGTGKAERVLRDRVPGFGTALDTVPAKLRPTAATAAGTLLAARAIPTHDERFTPTGSF